MYKSLTKHKRQVLYEVTSRKVNYDWSVEVRKTWIKERKIAVFSADIFVSLRCALCVWHFLCLCVCATAASIWKITKTNRWRVEQKTIRICYLVCVIRTIWTNCVLKIWWPRWLQFHFRWWIKNFNENKNLMNWLFNSRAIIMKIFEN